MARVIVKNVIIHVLIWILIRFDFATKWKRCVNFLSLTVLFSNEAQSCIKRLLFKQFICSLVSEGCLIGAFI